MPTRITCHLSPAARVKNSGEQKKTGNESRSSLEFLFPRVFLRFRPLFYALRFNWLSPRPSRSFLFLGALPTRYLSFFHPIAAVAVSHSITAVTCTHTSVLTTISVSCLFSSLDTTPHLKGLGATVRTPADADVRVPPEEEGGDGLGGKR